MMTIVETNPRVAGAARPDLPRWAAAEILDAPFSDGVVLRALVCRLGAGRWQWSILSLGEGDGEIICSGVEKTTLDARATAASEIAKCLENAIGEMPETA
ncbi:MAG TPA: hypothetical protein VFC56_08420 [Stellaceae bacterium]|nr:hypothetical protein [Stellaceae bacterium]